MGYTLQAFKLYSGMFAVKSSSQHEASNFPHIDKHTNAYGIEDALQSILAGQNLFCVEISVFTWHLW